MTVVSRRSFLAAAGITAVSTIHPLFALAGPLKSPFRVAVINDEISPDFDHACSVVANDFGLQWIELRSMWGKNMIAMGDDDLARAEAILNKYNLRVTDIASPLFKADWPGAPQSPFGPKNDWFHADFGYKQQDEVLEKSIALVKRFKTRRVRGFDFWRLEDQAPYRAAMDAKLAEAAETCGKHDVIFILENELDCNTATGREAARTLAAVKSPHLMLNWDPGNAVARGEVDAWPNGWNALPKNRIGHCHVKNAVKKPSGDGFEWAPVDEGIIDWTAQFKALKQIGYHDAVSLETHWKGGGSPEASTRISWAGMKKDLEQAQALS
jgi:sugar phosphate isomerase/epimerase